MITVLHAEMPVHEEGKPDPLGLQLWVDLPKQVGSFIRLRLTVLKDLMQHKMAEPTYQELDADQYVTLLINRLQ